MLAIAIFVIFAVILDAVSVGICTIVEAYSENASLLVFLALFVVNFVIAWQLAVRITERYLLSDAQRKANEEHTMWLNSPMAARR